MYSKQFVEALYDKLPLEDCSFEDFMKIYDEVYEQIHGEDC